MHTPNRFVLFTAIAGFSLLAAACGPEGDTAAESSPEAETSGGAGTERSDDVRAGSEERAAEAAKTAFGCTGFTKDLLERYGLEKQLVLNLSFEKGGNLQTMQETTGAPDPATFRSLADAFDGLDATGVEPMEMFDRPEVISGDLRKTADLLESALAAGVNPADPSWTALSEFYTQRFFGRHNASIAYYLNEAGCI